MAVAWFLVPYKVGTDPGGGRYRYCGVDDFTTQIWADNGSPQGNDGTTGPFWAEAECLGDYAVVKVRASATTLQAINAVPGVVGIAGSRLSDPLSSLTAAQKTALLAKLQALGYTLAEVQAALPNDLGTYTLGDVLRFVLRRRLKPLRIDPVLGTIFESVVQPTLDPSVVEAAVA